MAITKSKVLKKFEIDCENKTVSIVFDIIIYDDGGELARTKHRRAFAPGQIELIKTWAGVGDQNVFIQFLNNYWTQQVIDDYLRSIDTE